jgi:hypothetical protein
MSAVDQNALAHIQARAALSGVQVVERLVWIDRSGNVQIVRDAEHLEALLTGTETAHRGALEAMAPILAPTQPKGSEGMTAGLKSLLKAEEEFGVEAVEAAVDAHLAIRKTAKRTT